MWRRAVRIKRNCLLRKPVSVGLCFLCYSARSLHGLQLSSSGIQIFSPRTSETGHLTHQELDLKLGCYPEGNFILNFEYVFYEAIIPVCPNVHSGLRIDLLSSNPHTITVLAKTSLENKIDALFQSDLFHVHRAPFVDESRIARDDQ